MKLCIGVIVAYGITSEHRILEHWYYLSNLDQKTAKKVTALVRGFRGLIHPGQNLCDAHASLGTVIPGLIQEGHPVRRQ